MSDEAADAANFLMMISDNYAEEQSNATTQGRAVASTSQQIVGSLDGDK